MQEYLAAKRNRNRKNRQRKKQREKDKLLGINNGPVRQKPRSVEPKPTQYPKQQQQKPKKKKYSSKPRWKWSYDDQSGLLIWPVDELTGAPHHRDKTGKDFYKYAQGRIYVDGSGPRDSILPDEFVEVTVWRDRGIDELQDHAVTAVEEWLEKHFDHSVDKLTYMSEGLDWRNLGREPNQEEIDAYYYGYNPSQAKKPPVSIPKEVFDSAKPLHTLDPERNPHPLSDDDEMDDPAMYGPIYDVLEGHEDLDKEWASALGESNHLDKYKQRLINTPIAELTGQDFDEETPKTKKQPIFWIWSFDGKELYVRKGWGQGTHPDYSHAFNDDGMWTSQGAIWRSPDGHTSITIDSSKPYAYESAPTEQREMQDEAQKEAIKWVETFLETVPDYITRGV